MVITLTYLWRNRVQWELAETYGVSQSTVSRAIMAITPLLARALARHVPIAEELRPGRQYIVDGTLLPCWSWASDPGLYSGKHKTTGMNVQVVCTLDGELVWISDPVPGARHDVFCLDTSAALDGLNPSRLQQLPQVLQRLCVGAGDRHGQRQRCQAPGKLRAPPRGPTSCRN